MSTIQLHFLLASCNTHTHSIYLVFTHTLYVRMQVAQSTVFHIFISGDLYSSVCVFPSIYNVCACVCVCCAHEPLCDACVRACLRFIRLLTIRNITYGAKVCDRLCSSLHCNYLFFLQVCMNVCLSFSFTLFLSLLSFTTHTHTTC